jgi:hypothetical protein
MSDNKKAPAKAPAKTKPVGSGATARADGNIAAIYDQLAGHLSDGTGVTGMNFDRAKQIVGSSYDQSGYLMNRAASATQGGLNGQFDRLGIGAATDSATQGLRNQYAQGLMSAARRRENAMDTMGQQQFGYEQAGRMGVDNSRREGAQQRTDSVTRIEEALAAMEMAKAQAQGSVDLARTQGQMGLEKAKLEMAMQEREWQRELEKAQAGDPMAAMKAESLGLDIMKKKAELGQMQNPGPEDIDGKGDQALRQWLTQNPLGAGSLSRVNRLKDDAFVEAAKPNMMGYKSDPYDIAMGQLMSNQNYGGSERNRRLIEQALQVYFGKS